MRLNSRIGSLLLAHLPGGALCCWLAIMPLRPVTPLAITLSQAFLLGLWTAFSHAALWSRFLVLGMGTVYLVGMIGFVAGYPAGALAATTVSLGTAGVLLTARCWGMPLRRVTEPSRLPDPEPYQVQIRDLMSLTFVLALLFAWATGMRGVDRTLLIRMVVFGLGNVVLGLAATGAGLGITPPIKRLPVVLFLSLTLGTLFWFGVNSPSLEDYLEINVCLLMQSVVTYGSLLVVRSCGFRLTRRSSLSGASVPAP
jgi:hypothetical protein